MKDEIKDLIDAVNRVSRCVQDEYNAEELKEMLDCVVDVENELKTARVMIQLQAMSLGAIPLLTQVAIQHYGKTYLVTTMQIPIVAGKSLMRGAFYPKRDDGLSGYAYFDDKESALEYARRCYVANVTSAGGSVVFVPQCDFTDDDSRYIRGVKISGA